MSSTTSKIVLTPGSHGIVPLPGLTPAAAAAASAALSENHARNHIFFNDDGFHNHVAHYLLALFALGAPAGVIEAGYARESAYQRALAALAAPPEPDLDDPAQWDGALGRAECYVPFLRFFAREIEQRGVDGALMRHLFAATPSAQDLLVRLLAGFLHPFIHVGYGLEFGLPAVVAEGLAMAAVEKNRLAGLLLPAEAAAKEATEDTSATTLVALLDAIRQDDKLRDAPKWSDGNKIDGIMQRAPQEMVAHLRRYTVPVEQLRTKMAESINVAALFTAAAQREDKEIRIDFYYMHAHNASIFLPTYLSQPWLPAAAKARLLEWKARHDLVLYASRRSPALRIDDVRNYAAKEKAAATNPWLGIIARVIKLGDDGHTAKFIRACMNGERVCAEYQDHEQHGFVVRGDMWIRIAQMCIDSVEEEGARWARSVGFDEAWTKYGPRRTY